ncbi:MAG: PH domain-containing protein [Planctomycetota bacterium]
MTDPNLPSPASAPGADEPLVSTLETERLDRRVVAYWWLSGLVSSAILALFLGGLLFAGRVELEARQLWQVASWACGGLIGVKLAWALVAPPLSWARWRWGMDDQLLVLRWGIISHYERAIPVSRLQHIDLTRGPIERLFGLSTLVVHTAGTSAASFDLPGLADGVARTLRDRILAARGDDVV